MQILAQKVLEYLEYSSLDGKPERQTLRKQLKEFAEQILKSEEIRLVSSPTKETTELQDRGWERVNDPRKS